MQQLWLKWKQLLLAPNGCKKKSKLQKLWMVTPWVMTPWKLLERTNTGLQTEINTLQSQVDFPGEQKHRLLLLEVVCQGMSCLFFNKNTEGTQLKTKTEKLNRHVLYMTNQLYRTALAEIGGTAVTSSLEAKHCPSLAAASRVSKCRRIRLCYTTKCLCTVCRATACAVRESFV